MQKLQGVVKPIRGEDYLVDVRYLWGVLLDSKVLIVVLTAAGIVLALMWGIISPPVFQAEALIQLEKEGTENIFSKLYGLQPDDTSSASTEIVLIKSRSVLGKSVEDMGLDIEIEQEKFLNLAKAGARLLGQRNVQVTVPVFNVPEERLDQPFSLTILDEGRFSLAGDNVAMNGRFGEALNAEGMTIVVSQSDASPGTRFTLTKINPFKAIKNLEKNLNVVESSKDTGMLRLSLLGEDPKTIRRILSSISDNYVHKSIDKKSESARKSLTFVQHQLPLIKAQLEKAESRLNLFRKERGSIDLPMEARTILDSGVEIDSQLSALKVEQSDLSKRYTPAHPAFRALLEKKQALEKAKAALGNKISAMPETQQNVFRLTRDVQSAQDIYMLLLNKQQELNIDTVSTVGNVHIVDAAEVLPQPIYPKNRQLVLTGAVLGLVLSIALVFIRNVFRRGISGSDQLRQMGFSVFSSIPYSKKQQGERSGVSEPLLAISAPDDSAIEAIRSLRTSLYFQLKQAENKILMLAGATSHIGKSFISSNLAVVFAQSDLRVLLVDADMRRGYLHNIFNVGYAPGLSELLSSGLAFGQAIHHTRVSNLDVMTRGTAPSNPSELLLTPRFPAFCQWASEHYDVVIFDTPPVMAVGDAMIIANYSGVNLMVARFEVTTPDELDISLTQFAQEGYEVNGVVLNATHRRAAQFFRHGHYENYQYAMNKKS